MKIVNWSFGGLKLKSDDSKKALRNTIFFRSPFIVDFNLGVTDKIHIKKTFHPIHVTKNHIGAKVDESEM